MFLNKVGSKLKLSIESRFWIRSIVTVADLLTTIIGEATRIRDTLVTKVLMKIMIPLEIGKSNEKQNTVSTGMKQNKLSF